MSTLQPVVAVSSQTLCLVRNPALHGVLTTIEAYPSPCKRSVLIQGLRESYSPLRHEDEEDALTCALIAYLHSTQQEQLELPPEGIPIREGWIWIPKDVFS